MIQKRQEKSAPGNLTILSLERAKVYLKVSATSTDEDDIITDLINSAVSYLEQALGFFVDTNDFIYQYYDGFGDGVLRIWHRWILNDPNEFEVTYFDGTDWRVYAASNYTLDTVQMFPRITIKSTASTPSDLTDEVNSVCIAFKVDTTVPFYNDLKAAVMTLVAARYENREMADVPKIISAFIDKNRIPA